MHFVSVKNIFLHDNLSWLLTKRLNEIDFKRINIQRTWVILNDVGIGKSAVCVFLIYCFVGITSQIISL